MPTALKWVFGILGALLIAVTPYFWWVNANLLWISVPLIGIWAAWLMMEYLAWAKSLGKKSR